jgi:hypothetical protein
MLVLLPELVRSFHSAQVTAVATICSRTEQVAGLQRTVSTHTLNAERR